MTVTTLVERVFQHARARPDAPAVLTPDGTVSYDALAARVAYASAWLGEYGVGHGDRVVIALPNGPAAVVASLATQARGATAVEVNAEMGESALTRIVRAVDARVHVVRGRDAALWGALDVPSPEHRWLLHPRAPPPQLLAALGGEPFTLLQPDGILVGGPVASSQDVPQEAVDAEDAAALVYTSGSTGAPRGVVHTFGNIEANTRAIVTYLELDERDRAMAILPLSYTFGKSVLQTHLWVGGSVFFDHRFVYPRVVVAAIAEHGCTGFYGVPLTFELLRRQVSAQELATPSLRVVAQAGGHLEQGTREWLRDAVAPAQVFIMYGQTEATARLSYLPPARLGDKPSSIGVPIPGVELAVVEEGGALLPDGETGFLVARGDNVTPGYFHDDAATAEILHDGWLWTGDLGYRDDEGYFFLTGRAREMLKVGGHRVSPMEIEDVLLTHPAVVEAAVVGVHDPMGGDVPVAFVVVDAEGVTDAELRRMCRGVLPPYKVPAHVVFLTELPHNERGKVAKDRLPRDQIFAREGTEG